MVTSRRLRVTAQASPVTCHCAGFLGQLRRWEAAAGPGKAGDSEAAARMGAVAVAAARRVDDVGPASEAARGPGGE